MGKFGTGKGKKEKRGGWERGGVKESVSGVYRRERGGVECVWWWWCSGGRPDGRTMPVLMGRRRLDDRRRYL